MLALEGVAARYAVDPNAAAERAEGHRQRRLGHAVARHERTGVEAHRLERVGERGQGLRTDHLATDTGDPPAAEIELACRAIRGPPGAKLEAEGRAEGDRPAKARDQLQPDQRAPCERGRAQIVDRDLRHHRGQAAADQAHVVIKWQPRGAPVAGAQRQTVDGDGAGVGSQRCLGDQDAAGKAGAAGAVLDVADIVSAERLERRVRRGPGRQLVGRGRELDRGADHGFAQDADQLRPGHRRTGASSSEHAAQPLDISVLAAEIDAQGQWHRHKAGILTGEEDSEEVARCLGDDADPIAADQLGRREPPRQAQRFLTKLAVRQRSLERATAREEIDAGVAPRSVVQPLDQRREVAGAEWQSRVRSGRCLDHQ